MGLRALGIERGDRVAILSENRPEWAILDLATLAAGAVSVPVYPTLPASQVAHILSDSGAKAVVAENAKQVGEGGRRRASPRPDLALVIALDEAAAKDGILSLDAVIEAGEAAQFEESYEARRDSVQPGRPDEPGLYIGDDRQPERGDADARQHDGRPGRRQPPVPAVPAAR